MLNNNARRREYLPWWDKKLLNVLFQLINSSEMCVQQSHSEPCVCTVFLLLCSCFYFYCSGPCVHVFVFLSLSVFFNCSQRGRSLCGSMLVLGEKKKCCIQVPFSTEHFAFFLCGCFRRFLKNGRSCHSHFFPGNQLYIRWTWLNTCHPSKRENDWPCLSMSSAITETEKPISGSRHRALPVNLSAYDSCHNVGYILASEACWYIVKLNRWCVFIPFLSYQDSTALTSHWSPWSWRSSIWITIWVHYISTIAKVLPRLNFTKMDSEIYAPYFTRVKLPIWNVTAPLWEELCFSWM